MTWKFVEIQSSTYPSNIQVESTSIRCGVPVGKSWICSVLVCKQDRVAGYKGSLEAMKGLGIGKKRFQHSIVGHSNIPTDSNFKRSSLHGQQT